VRVVRTRRRYCTPNTVYTVLTVHCNDYAPPLLHARDAGTVTVTDAVAYGCCILSYVNPVLHQSFLTPIPSSLRPPDGVCEQLERSSDEC
jgi:hypothetical protein